MDNLGSISIDLIFSTLIIIILIGSMITIIAERLDTATESEELGSARMLAENIAETINKVYSGGNGHKISIDLPPSIGKNHRDYQIRVNSSGVFIELKSMDMSGKKVGKAFIVPGRISKNMSFGSSEVIMQSNKKYLIANIKDSNGYDWIVITPI